MDPLKDRVAGEKKPSNSQTLIEAVKYVWYDNISCDCYKFLTDSMSHRILSSKKAKVTIPSTDTNGFFVEKEYKYLSSVSFLF